MSETIPPAEGSPDEPESRSPESSAPAPGDLPPDEVVEIPPAQRADDGDEGEVFELPPDPAEVNLADSVQVALSDPPADETPAALEEHNEPHIESTAPRIVARYGLMRQIGEFRHNLQAAPRPGTRVVIRTERGVELGEVLMGVGGEESSATCRRCMDDKNLRHYIQECGPEYPYRRDGKVLRLANPQDVVDQRHLDGSAHEEALYCRAQIREMGLKMKLVTVEHLLGGERIIFYFSSETRVDFRDLVRRLATQFRTRIEMRQVGARDEARLVGDYERCGQQCCCQSFLKNLKPVSMRMAKTQKATLDPSKISGRCGRLMCCLRYEDLTYEELRKKLPKKGIWVKTSTGIVGRVFDTQIISQLVRLWQVDGTQVAVPNEDIIERDVPAPPMPQPREDRRPPREKKEKGPPRLLRDSFETPAPTAANSAPAVAAPAESPAPPSSPEGSPAEDLEGDEQSGPEDAADHDAPDNAPGGAPGQAQGDGSKRRRRRRRRRRGRGGGGGQGNAPQNPPPPSGP